MFHCDYVQKKKRKTQLSHQHSSGGCINIESPIGREAKEPQSFWRMNNNNKVVTIMKTW
jgi:hypothetical protein